MAGPSSKKIGSQILGANTLLVRAAKQQEAALE
jgi:hypothetical protein